MTPNENSHFFLASQRNRPKRVDGSWWLNLPRAEHQAAAEARKVQMSNSPEAQQVSRMVIGYVKP